MTILTFSICGADNPCRAAPEKKGAGKGFISAVCFGRQRRNVSGDVHLPSQDQALVFCGRHPTHHPGSGGNFIFTFGISFSRRAASVQMPPSCCVFYFNSKYNRARSVSRSSARDNVRGNSRLVYAHLFGDFGQGKPVKKVHHNDLLLPLGQLRFDGSV